MLPRVIEKIREKHLETWLGGWARDRVRAAALRPRVEGPRHLVFAFCDHYEPLWGDATDDKGDERVRAWEDGYPRMVDGFRDADGRPPQHSFFFPGEQYRPIYIERLARLAKAGFGEVELHLHHDGDDEASLRRDIPRYLGELASHGHLSRTPSGALRFAFIHGNWALANARKDGRWCGVDGEIPLLFELGCYADFTFPAAPNECQPDIVNQIYWPTGNMAARRAYETGERARVGVVRRDRMLLVEGPIALARRGLGVRIESAAITARDPGTPSRIRTWVKQNIHVEGRPEWVFVKIHTHGAPDREGASLLGEPGRAMHRELTTRYNDGRSWVLHYVTAREMYNVAMAAMAGKSGNPSDYRDFLLPPPPVRS